MTSPDRDLEDLLRRALHASVDSIEPASGGLDRIRSRAAAPRLWRQAQLLLTECLDLVRLVGIRLEPLAARVGTPVGQAGRRVGTSRPAAVTVLAARRLGAWAIVLLRKLTASEHDEQGRPERPRPTSWLRPALVVAGTVFIVVAGVYGVSQLKHSVTTIGLLNGDSPTSSPGAPTPQTSGNAPVGSASPSHATTSSSTASHSQPHATPKPTCSKGTGSAPSTPPVAVSSPPATTPAESPSPTASASPSGSGSTTSSSSGTSTNATSSGSGAPASNAAAAQLTGACGTSSPAPGRGTVSSSPSP